MIIYRVTILFITFLVLSCAKSDTNLPNNAPTEQQFISAVDISSYPEIMTTNPRFYDTDGTPKNLLDILKSKGVNTIRLRLWVNPSNEHSGLNEVRQFAVTLKNSGFKIWLTVHYSDTWADPAHQQMPAAWQNSSYTALKDSVYAYTKKVVTQIQPHYIQVGNEINSGFLHPYGNLSINNTQFKGLLQSGILAVRENAKSTKIMLHFAGIDAATSFFGNLNALDYDIIALSYYPIWHGKSLTTLSNTITNLSMMYNKEVVIAETAYPFTLNWNDWTNNIVGMENQLILPDFPPTVVGQRDFIKSIRELMQAIPNRKGIGLCYWGAELVAWKGTQATNASPWENQALFDFQNQVLPALIELKGN